MSQSPPLERRSRSSAFSETPPSTSTSTSVSSKGRAKAIRKVLATLEEDEPFVGRRRSGAFSFSTPLATSTPVPERLFQGPLPKSPKRELSSAISGGSPSPSRSGVISGIGSPTPPRRERSSAISGGSPSRPGSGALTGIGSPTPPRRGRSFAISGGSPSRPGSGALTGIGSPTPPRRERSSAISGGSPSRPRSGALPGIGSPTPPRRDRSSAISGSSPSRAGLAAMPGLGREQLMRNLSPSQSKPASPPPRRQRSSAITSSSFGQQPASALPSAPAFSALQSPIKAQQPAMPSQEEVTESTEDAIPLADPKFLEYVRKKQSQHFEPVSAYGAYDPHGLNRGPGRSFGRGRGAYPQPTMEELAQNEPGYEMFHQSEEGLPQTDTGDRAVYGELQGPRGGPLHGPLNWVSFYTEWQDIGNQYQQTSDINEPMPQEERDFCRKYGFEFIKKLGSGGQASVWLCKVSQDPSTGTVGPPNMIACKICDLIHHKGPRTLEQAVNRLLKEANLLENLEHANIVNCEHVMHIHDPLSGFPFVRVLIFMELCDGDLKDLLEKQPNRRLSESMARVVMKDVTLALEYLHCQNVSHLDIKLHNIMHSDRSGRMSFKLGDFGVANRHKAACVITTRTGTASYMAPEISNIGKKGYKKIALTKPADIYSLGKVLAEMLGGRMSMTRFVNDLHKNSTNGVPSEDVRNRWHGVSEAACRLIIAMTYDDPKRRLTVEKVRTHPWMTQQ